MNLENSKHTSASRWCCCIKLSDLSTALAGDNGQDVVQNVLTVSYCVCVFSEGRSGFDAADDDEWSPALELDGVGMMDLHNGQSSIITTTAAIVSEVRPRPLARLPPTLFHLVHASPSTFQHWQL